MWMCKDEQAVLTAVTRRVYSDSAMCMFDLVVKFPGYLMKKWNFACDSVDVVFPPSENGSCPCQALYLHTMKSVSAS